jgi:hypothetical protein
MKTAQILTSHLGVAIFVAMIYTTWLLRRFSQRIGEVTRMPPTYRWFNIGNVLIFIALLGYMFQCSAALAFEEPGSVWILKPLFSLFTFYIPLTLGISIDVTVAFIYWGWLIREL